MRTVAGLLNIVLGIALGVVVATVVNLDFPANVFAWIVGGLLAVAGIAILVRASWGAQLGQWLGMGGILLGLALIAGAAVALVTAQEWGGLVGAVLLALGVPVLLASVLAFLANRRARHSSPDL
ncbi:MAG TPA: hypothetical protein VF071_12060 [Candidatus Limnocylindria bacterium]